MNNWNTAALTDYEMTDLLNDLEKVPQSEEKVNEKYPGFVDAVREELKLRRVAIPQQVVESPLPKLHIPFGRRMFLTWYYGHISEVIEEKERMEQLRDQIKEEEYQSLLMSLVAHCPIS